VSAPAYRTALGELLARPHRPLTLTEGISIEGLPTPALLLDEGALMRNVEKMAAFLGAQGKGFRPHAKTHKCPEIARRQLASGAVGICAAKISEAAVLMHAGVDRVLITSAITSAAKAELAAELSGLGQLDIVVDSPLGVKLLGDAMTAGTGDELGVLIDLDEEMGRTGTRSDDVAISLAEQISRTPGLKFRGVQHYAGHLMHVAGFDERRSRSLALWERVSARVDRLQAAGHPCSVVTGCGTGTFNIDCEVPAVTDLQVGSYVFMDQEYLLIGGRDSDRFDDFEVSLTMATTAISEPLPGKAVTVDGGFKAFASDSVPPEPLDMAGSRFRFAGDEHGVLIFGAGTQQPTLGSVQRFITPHCDPTVNLHDAFWVHDGDRVHARWPISARGCSW